MTFYARNGILYIRLGSKRVSTKLVDTPKNRKLVESYNKNGEFFDKFGLTTKIPTVLEYAEQILLEKEKTLKNSTMVCYYSVFNTKVIPFFKGKLVTDIKAIDISNFYKLFKDRGSRAISCVILKQVFERSIIEDFIKYSPLVVSYPRIKSTYEKNPFSLDEVNLILSTESKIKNLLGVAFTTGLRGGEIIGLRWEDIDFLNNKISVNRTIKYGIEQTPKTKGSLAVIDLPIESKIYFQKQLKLTGLKKSYVFLNDGKRFNSLSTISYHFGNLLKELNLKHRGIHQTRHTFASLKLSYGERLEWVSYMLRHDSPALTQNVYFKYIPRIEEKRVVLNFDLAQNRHSGA
ncbi:MAG: tyrosine-type recombinase/integrase [Aliarcobacter sp.]|nr:tyrosine-type recombinase/integrase [Aliarcobacter sp.]